MKHIHPATRPQPLQAQVVGELFRSFLAAILFGLNPIFVFLLGRKVSGGLLGGDNEDE